MEKRKFPFIGNRIRKEKNWKKRVMECKKILSCADCLKQRVFTPIKHKIHFKAENTKPKFVRADEWDKYGSSSGYNLLDMKMKTFDLTDEFWDGMNYGVVEW
jgi:hypothetical protein